MVAAKVNGSGPQYARVVAKLGTNVLTGRSDGLDLNVMAGLAHQVAILRGQGVEVVVVTSGAIAAGREALAGAKAGADVLFKQVLAAVGQSKLMHRYQEVFEPHGIQTAQALVTKGDLDDREGYLNVRNTLEGLLAVGVVPIVNENDVVDVAEIGQVVFGDNDNLSAMIANVINADLLALLTDMDGLYTADPRKDTHAQLIPVVDRVDSEIEALAGGAGSERSRGGMVTKIQAAKAAMASGVTVVVANGFEPGVLQRLVSGERIGTLFRPMGNKVASRHLWMMSGVASRGRIVVDDGAVSALNEDNRSLLPAGIQGVDGEFARGDVVEIVDSKGVKIGCGLTNYSINDLTKIKGAKSSEISGLLGYRYGDEVVHRNDLVLLRRPVRRKDSQEEIEQ